MPQQQIADKPEVKKPAGRGSPNGRKSPHRPLDNRKSPHIQVVAPTKQKEDLLPYIDMICDPELEPASKVSVMKHIQSHPEDIFLPHSPKMAEEFENLVDSLIYHLLVYTDYEQKEESK